jgi:hypothetical protein
VVTVENSAFVSNVADFGGGLFNNNGAVTIVGSTFDSNRSFGGGALVNSGELTIIGSTFSNNVADEGGGRFTTTGIVRIIRSRFTKNNAAHFVGGIVFAEDFDTLAVWPTALSVIGWEPLWPWTRPN